MEAARFPRRGLNLAMRALSRPAARKRSWAMWTRMVWWHDPAGRNGRAFPRIRRRQLPSWRQADPRGTRRGAEPSARHPGRPQPRAAMVRRAGKLTTPSSRPPPNR